MDYAQDILNLEQQRCTAMMGADVPLLSQLFADDMVWIHASAKVDGKAGVLNTIGSGKTKYLAIDCSDQQVRLYGETAIVGGVADMKLESAGEVRSLKNRYTIHWLKQAGGWQVVNWQSTSVKAA
ncbi:nuclear transport factor 2 family protein [Duganella radicis]|nr:nuclear transport factor 2 family protein [Duganella radicis]